VDPETGKVFPGHFDPKSGKPVDPKSKKPVKEPELPTEDDKKKWVPTRVLNDPAYEQFNKDPSAFINGGMPGENPPNQPDYSNPNQSPSEVIAGNPGKLPKNPAQNIPDELNRRPGGRYNPATGCPIDPDYGMEYPIDDKTKQPYDPRTGENRPGLFDPISGQPILPETGEVLPAAFDFKTGRPIDVNTGEVAPINSVTGQCTHPETGVVLPDKYDPKTGRKIDPKTNAPVPANYDTTSGRPINPETGEVYPIKSDSGRPFDPQTGRVFPGQYDPKSGKPVIPGTTEPSNHSSFDPDTGRPLDKAGKPFPLNENGVPVDPVTKEEKPGCFEPTTGRQQDPVSGDLAPMRYDPNCGRPIDPVTEHPLPINSETNQPFNPRTGETYPGTFSPETGMPIGTNGEVLPDRFDAKTGRPIDPKTKEPFPIDEKTKTPYNPATKKPMPGSFDKDGKPLDPKTKKEIKAPEEPVVKNNKNNYVPRKWVQVITDPLDNHLRNDPQGRFKQHLADNDPQGKIPKRNWKDTGRPGFNPPNNPDVSLPEDPFKPYDPNDVGKIPRRPLLRDPDELNRKPGKRYNPHNGCPIDPDTGKDCVVDDKLNTPKTKKGDNMPGKFDPVTHQPLDPETN